MQKHCDDDEMMKLCAEVAISLLSLSAHMALKAYIVLHCYFYCYPFCCVLMSVQSMLICAQLYFGSIMV